MRKNDGQPGFKLSIAGLAGAAVCAATPAAAGPPYLTDDPIPTDTGHWEIYNFATAAGAREGLGGSAGVDLNYGPAKDLQITLVLPLAVTAPSGFSLRGIQAGPGQAELAAKYRFLHQVTGSWVPDLAVFPRLFAPAADRRFGDGQAQLLLPVWAQKDFGPWSVFGGGGYEINPGRGQANFWQGGVAVSRTFGERFSLGAELYGQTRQDRDGGGAYTAVNLAATYRVAAHWSLLASAGPTWNTGGADGYGAYLALKADY